MMPVIDTLGMMPVIDTLRTMPVIDTLRMIPMMLWLILFEFGVKISE